MGNVTDDQVRTFARTLVRSMHHHVPFDQDQAASFMQSLLHQVIDEQLVVIDYIGGLGAYPRDELHKLLADTAKIELTRVFEVFSETFASEMKDHVTPTAEPTEAP